MPLMRNCHRRWPAQQHLPPQRADRQRTGTGRAQSATAPAGDRRWRRPGCRRPRGRAGRRSSGARRTGLRDPSAARRTAGRRPFTGFGAALARRAFPIERANRDGRLRAGRDRGPAVGRLELDPELSGRLAVVGRVGIGPDRNAVGAGTRFETIGYGGPLCASTMASARSEQNRGADASPRASDGSSAEPRRSHLHRLRQDPQRRCREQDDRGDPWRRGAQRTRGMSRSAMRCDDDHRPDPPSSTMPSCSGKTAPGRMPSHRQSGSPSTARPAASSAALCVTGTRSRRR